MPNTKDSDFLDIKKQLSVAEVRLISKALNGRLTREERQILKKIKIKLIKYLVDF